MLQPYSPCTAEHAKHAHCKFPWTHHEVHAAVLTRQRLGHEPERAAFPEVFTLLCKPRMREGGHAARLLQGTVTQR